MKDGVELEGLEVDLGNGTGSVDGDMAVATVATVSRVRFFNKNLMTFGLMHMSTPGTPNFKGTDIYVRIAAKQNKDFGYLLANPSK